MTSAIARLVTASTATAAVGLSVLARRERSRARYWRRVAELELHLHNPAKLRQLQAAHDRGPGRVAVRGEQLLTRSVRLIAGRPFNQSRAGVAAPARGLPVTGC